MKVAATLFAGLVIGATAAHFHGPVFRPGPADRQPNDAFFPASVAPDNPETTAAPVSLDADGLDADGSPLVGERLLQFGAAARIDDVTELVLRIGQLAEQAQGHSRDVELHALVMRLAELDPVLAMATLTRWGLGYEYAALVYRSWMMADADAALASMSTIGNPTLSRIVVMSLMEQFQGDELALARILAAVPGENVLNLTIDELVQRAAYDPAGALADALQISEIASRERAARRIAAAWAVEDPAGAMQAVASIPFSRLRDDFQMRVLAEWARVDPMGALDYIMSDTVANRGVALSALPVIAAADPERTLQAAEVLPARFREAFRTQALTALADRDSLAMIARADALPEGGDRQQLLRAIADAYSRQDPEGALAWVAATGSTNLKTIVVHNIALQHPLQALDFALTQPDAQYLNSVIFRGRGGPPALSPESVNPAQMPQVANRMLLAGDAHSETLQAMLQSWSQVDPDGALSWALESNAVVGTDLVASLARGFARGDQQTSSGFLSGLPAESRSRWIAEVARVYAATDPNAALDWLSEYRHDPDYDAWVAAAAQHLEFDRNFDPAAVGRLLGSATQVPAQAVRAVASQWALQDPHAALQWARGLPDEEARTAAAVATAAGWMIHNPNEAQQWALTQTDPVVRDRVLATVLTQGIASHGIVDSRIVDGFASDSALQQALRGSVPALVMLHNRNPRQAQALIEAHFTDPNLQQDVETQLQRAAEARLSFPSPNTPILLR